MATSPETDIPALSDSSNTLWAPAFDDFQTKDPELSQELLKNVSESNASHDELASEAVAKAQATVDAKTNSRWSKFREHAEKTVKFVLLAKDAIGAVATSNPYASLAWSGVCLVLPLVLAPTEENEAAMEGLSVISKYIVIYRWKEKTYHRGGDAGDFANAVRKLYAAILEYEAKLLHHMRRNVVGRFTSNIIHAGDWTTQTSRIEKLAADCFDLTEALSERYAEEWRGEERGYWQQLNDQPRLEKEEKNIQLLYSLYEDGKNANPLRLPKTGEWLLANANFLAWREAQTSTFLWVSAHPGCGKSVLAKYLIDRKGEALSVQTQQPLICYFFFKDNISGDQQNDGRVALRALLHQLFLQRPHLYARYAENSFRAKGPRFLEHFDEVWGIFERCMTDDPKTETICVLDALDECEDRSKYALMKKLVELYKPSIATKKRPSFKTLVTSRPHADIVRRLKPIIEANPAAYVSADEEVATLQREIDHFIDVKVEEIAEARDLQPGIIQLLRKRLKDTQSRTYLWLHIVLDVIDNQDLLNRSKVEAILETIPQELEDAYSAMLSTSQDPDLARKILGLVLAATRPLTIKELTIAVSIDRNCRSRTDVRQSFPWSLQTARQDIQNTCRLFVTIVNDTVHLIHQTAKEFLVRDLKARPPSPPGASNVHWKYTIDLKEANSLLATACMYQLLLEDFKVFPARPGLVFLKSAAEYSLYEYSAVHWALHFRDAGSLTTSDEDLSTAGQLLCSSSYRARWQEFFAKSELENSYSAPLPLNGDAASWAARLGLYNIVDMLLRPDEPQDNLDDYGRSALLFAASIGCVPIVELLLDKRPSLNVADTLYQTPLTYAIQNRHSEVIRLLSQTQTSSKTISTEDVFNKTPIEYSTENFGTEVRVTQRVPTEYSSSENANSREDTGNESLVAHDSSDVSTTSEQSPTTLQQLVLQIETFITEQLATGAWKSRSSNSTLYHKKDSQRTGLGQFYDSLMLALDEFSDAQDPNLVRARSHLLDVIDAIPIMVVSESPFLLPHVFRAVAFCAQAGLARLGCLLVNLISRPVPPSYDGSHPLRLILKSMSSVMKSYTNPGKICITLLETIISVLSTALGPYHMQTVWTTTVKIAVQGRLYGAAVNLAELARLQTEIETHTEPGSSQFIQTQLTLARTQLQHGAFDDAKVSSAALVDRLTRLLTTGPTRGNRSSASLCDGYSIMAQAEVGLGNLDSAEELFEQAALTARAIGGPNTSAARKHKEAFTAWLISQGRWEKLDETQSELT